MKTLIICVSTHHGNTEKIAKKMATVLNAKLARPDEVNISELPDYDLIGFGSGIYLGKHHRSLFDLVDKLPVLKNKKAFVFATSGLGNWLNIFNNIRHGTTSFQDPLKKKLLKKGFDVIGEFSCRGFTTFGLFKLIGGIKKGRPNEEDLRNAENFARKLQEKLHRFPE